MSQVAPASNKKSSGTSHRIFAAFYERLSRSSGERNFIEPLRKEIIAQAHGLVLEVGAGTGLNFALYDPERVQRVEATDPDSAMLRYARERAQAARVPITITQAAAEDLPFPGETFDSAVATLVFCSVSDPLRGLGEIKRVLKPGGALLMIEHVRAHSAIAATMQDIVTPFTRLFAGNCHWNRSTAQTVIAAGFQVQQIREVNAVIMPGIVLRAVKP